MDPSTAGFRHSVSEGDACLRRGLYARAVEAFSRALDIRKDKHVLLNRSRCYVSLSRAQLAIEDADMAIGQDKHFYRGIYQKGEALFASGDFEFAL
ncbi:hypothetical protein KIPB_014078, partial [Kipferlia bialata]|eukprot:g14078.t1